MIKINKKTLIIIITIIATALIKMCIRDSNGGNTRGYAMATEGSQYKYYKTNLGSTSYSNSTNVTKKPNTSSSYYWWLRSPDYNDSTDFCDVYSSGNCLYDSANYNNGVAPGFSI